jgi:hypothetical protein
VKSAKPATFVMERKMLLLIKQLAEKGRSKEAAEGDHRTTREGESCIELPTTIGQAASRESPVTHPRSRAMLAAQASMACQSRKSPLGARTAFAIIRSANDSL